MTFPPPLSTLMYRRSFLYLLHPLNLLFPLPSLFLFFLYSIFFFLTSHTSPAPLLSFFVFLTWSSSSSSSSSSSRPPADKKKQRCKADLAYEVMESRTTERSSEVGKMMRREPLIRSTLQWGAYENTDLHSVPYWSNGSLIPYKALVFQFKSWSLLGGNTLWFSHYFM